MGRSDFLEALARQLTRRGVPHVYADMVEFVDDVWPIAEDRPDVSRSAREYAEAHAAAVE
jgi:hypothetical protein